jgi:hypothetical protein
MTRPHAVLAAAQAGDGDAEGGAGNVVETRPFAEGDRGRVAAVFAADAELDVGARRPAALAGDGDQFADPFGVQSHERIGPQEPLDGVCAEE